jgi:hypothetical protein
VEGTHDKQQNPMRLNVPAWDGDQVVIAPRGNLLFQALGQGFAREAVAAEDGTFDGRPPSGTASHSIRSIATLSQPHWTYVLSGASSEATLYAAYSFAEDVLGIRFYPHGDVVPDNSSAATSSSAPSEHYAANLPDLGTRDYVATFTVRGANTWGTWTEGFDWWPVQLCNVALFQSGINVQALF